MILGTMTFTKIKLYESPLTYWTSVKADYPSSFLPYVGLYNYYSYKEDNEEAERQLLQAIVIRPEELSIRNKLCDFYEKHNLSSKEITLLQKTLIDDRLYSDYMAGRYIDLLFKTNGKNAKGFNDLINAYKDDEKILEKINKITQIKKSGLDVL